VVGVDGTFLQSYALSNLGGGGGPYPNPKPNEMAQKKRGGVWGWFWWAILLNLAPLQGGGGGWT